MTSLARIANDELGLRTRLGARISVSTMHKIFRNPFYAGFFHWGGQRYQGLHEPMVT